jgi:hypothetical protein
LRRFSHGHSSGGRPYDSLTILSLLAGALLGLRFSVYVLVFAIYFGAAVIAGVGAAVEIEVWRIALDIAVGAIALQVGYFAGGALMSDVAPSRLLPA